MSQIIYRIIFLLFVVAGAFVCRHKRRRPKQRLLHRFHDSDALKTGHSRRGLQNVRAGENEGKSWQRLIFAPTNNG